MKWFLMTILSILFTACAFVSVSVQSHVEADAGDDKMASSHSQEAIEDKSDLSLY